MESSLTVFICSTFSDLSAEREAVLEAVRKLQLRHDSMEFFGARPSLPIETCLEEVRRSNILVVIVGHKYGSLVPDKIISFSEAEYSEGYRLGKPCLVYLRNEDVPILPKHMERDPQKLLALESFKGRLKERHTVATFSDAHDLAVSVAADLSRTVQALEETQKLPSREKHPSANSILDEINQLIRQAIDKQVSEPALLSAASRAITSLLTVQGKRPPTVFFSYSHSDKEIVIPFAAGLRTEGINVWLDEDTINHGQSIADEISRGLESADFLAFFISKNSINSPWARLELNAIMSKRLRGNNSPLVLPVLLDDAEVPALLRDRKYLDLRDRDTQRGVQKLLKSIRRFLTPMTQTFTFDQGLVSSEADASIDFPSWEEALTVFQRNYFKQLLASTGNREEAYLRSGLRKNQFYAKFKDLFPLGDA